MLSSIPPSVYVASFKDFKRNSNLFVVETLCSGSNCVGGNKFCSAPNSADNLSKFDNNISLFSGKVSCDCIDHCAANSFGPNLSVAHSIRSNASCIRIFCTLNIIVNIPT